MFLDQFPAQDKLISFPRCRIAQVFAECKSPGDRNPSLFHPETWEKWVRGGGFYLPDVLKKWLHFQGSELIDEFPKGNTNSPRTPSQPPQKNKKMQKHKKLGAIALSRICSLSEFAERKTLSLKRQVPQFLKATIYK